VSGWAYDVRTIGVLWQRDLTLFLRQRSRVIGALATPLLLWLAIGAGIAPSFRMARGDVGYMEYFFPGIVFMLLLNLSISATMSVIEDRRQRFLQGVLVAPGSHPALVLGKTLGSATVAMLHAVLLLLLVPLAGFPYAGVDWPSALLVLTLTSVSFTALGFMLAWALDSVQGYHVVMSLVLFPLWMLSGALFPAEGLNPVLRTIVTWNPMSYAMSGLRRALYGGALPDGLSPIGASATTEFAILLTTTLLLVAAACWVASRRQASN